MSNHRPSWLSEEDGVFFKHRVNEIKKHTELNIYFKKGKQATDGSGLLLSSNRFHKRKRNGTLVKTDSEKPIMTSTSVEPHEAENIYAYIQFLRIPVDKVNYLINLAQTDPPKYRMALDEFNTYLKSLFYSPDLEDVIGAGAGVEDADPLLDLVGDEILDENGYSEDNAPLYSEGAPEGEETLPEDNINYIYKTKTFLNGSNNSLVGSEDKMPNRNEVNTYGLEEHLDRAMTTLRNLSGDVKSGKQLQRILNEAGIESKRVLSIYDFEPERGAKRYLAGINSALGKEFVKAGGGGSDAALDENSLNNLEYDNFLNLVSMYDLEGDKNNPIIEDAKFIANAKQELMDNKRFSKEAADKLWEFYKLSEPDAEMDPVVFLDYINNTNAGQALLSYSERTVRDYYGKKVKTNDRTETKTELFKYLAGSIARKLTNEEGFGNPDFGEKLEREYSTQKES